MKTEGEVVGFDCDGRPLRAGDLVLMVTGPNVKAKWAGTTAVIVGKTQKAVKWDVRMGRHEHLEHDDGHVALSTSCRKIDNPQSASWSDIHKSIGWSPRVTEKTPKVMA